jgi:hypothetical protein
VSVFAGSLFFWVLVALGALASLAIVVAILAWPKDNSF